MTLDAAHAQPSADAPTHTVEAIGARWAVAAGHPLAAAAAARLLQAGGNAIDAGVAGGLCLGVVHPDMVSFAGVAPVLVHLAGTRETWQVSGVGPYPRAVTLEYFRDRHRGEIPPGVPRACGRPVTPSTGAAPPAPSPPFIRRTAASSPTTISRRSTWRWRRRSGRPFTRTRSPPAASGAKARCSCRC